jgi:dihydroflavonol-4-reductase
MSSQVLITGATGFIGRQLTRNLVLAGHHVRVLARNRNKAQAMFGDDVEVTVGDLGLPKTLDQACRNREIVYHIAGIYRFGLRHRRELWRVNVEGTENLLRSAAAADVGKVVHLSSASVLSKESKEATDSTLLTETDFSAAAPRFSPYKLSKWHAEQRVLAWARRGLPVAIASTTCPIGWGDETPTPTGRIIRDFLDQRFPFYCRTGLNFIGIGDLSEGLQQVASRGEGGERYLLCHENLWLKNLLDLLAEETGLTAPGICLPNGLIRLIGCCGEVIDLLGSGSAPARVCLETALQAEQVQFFSNAKARQALGWQPKTSLRENLQEAIAWFRRKTPVEVRRHAPVSIESHVQ